jgi:hypothetical protein
MPFSLRCATDGDAKAIAEVSFSYHLLTFLPMLHTIKEYQQFVANTMLKECAVTVVGDDTGIISFLARQGEEVRQLYTRPDRIGRGPERSSSRRRSRAGSRPLNYGAFRPTHAHGTFTKCAVFTPFALRMVRTTRSGRLTSAIGGNGPQIRTLPSPYFAAVR